MNWDIIGAIWLCLLIAAILGGIIGWLLKSLSCKKKCDALYADLSAKDEELARLRASLSKAKGDASAENTKDDGEIAALKAQIAKLEGSLTASANLDADWKSKYSLLQTDLTGWKDKHGKLEADFAAKAAVAPVTVEKIVEKIVEKPVEVIKTVEVIKEVQVSNDTAWEAKYAKLEADLRISHDRQGSMEDELKKFAMVGGTAAVAAAATTGGGNDAEVAKLKAEIDSLKEKLEETEGEKTYLMTRMKSAEAGEVRKVVPMDQRDDLELIHGVGPVIEGMLYDEGIYFFKDVASWGDAEIAEISAKLPQFKNRIRRENWVDSAKEEHFKKYGEKL
jgi:predicted flap endonuclease-1-like 5' DNA nuclease